MEPECSLLCSQELSSSPSHIIFLWDTFQSYSVIDIVVTVLLLMLWPASWLRACRDESMFSSWQNFMCWIFKSAGMWLCIVGWAVLTVLDECSAFTFRVWRFFKMCGTTHPPTHCCISEDLNLSNTGVRTWNLAVYLMFMLILFDIWR
jgi:hypothetical protein